MSIIHAHAFAPFPDTAQTTKHVQRVRPLNSVESLKELARPLLFTRPEHKRDKQSQNTETAAALLT